MLQGCHHEPAIKHAVIAVGSLYEQFRFRGAYTTKFALTENNPALKHYLSAIALILKEGGSEHASKVALIVCILFVNFEVRKSLSVADFG